MDTFIAAILVGGTILRASKVVFTFAALQMAVIELVQDSSGSTKKE